MSDPTNTEDFKMLERIAEKAGEALCADVDPNKTISQWRQEMGQLISETMFYVAKRKSA